MSFTIVLAFVDNNTKQEREIPVLSPYNFKKTFNSISDAVLIAVENSYSVGDIFFQLHEMGINQNIFAVKADKWKKRLKIKSIRDECIWGGDFSRKAVITKLEFHVCDHCNLNCVGCTHFAPIYQESFASLDEFARDMKRLSEDFYILRLRLMGGEPLLNPDLPEYIDLARNFFPHSHLAIVTNGLLLPRTDQRVFDSIKKNDAFVQISLYPPTYAMREKIKATLEAQKIDFSFGSGLVQANEEGIIKEFHQCFTGVKEGRGREAAKRCLGSSCHFLRHGKISKCALPLLAEDINAYFGRNLEVLPEDYVDIYDKEIDPWEKVRRLKEATPFCDYCGDGTSTRFDWKCGGEILFSDYLK